MATLSRSFAIARRANLATGGNPWPSLMLLAAIFKHEKPERETVIHYAEKSGALSCPAETFFRGPTNHLPIKMRDWMP